MSLKIINIKHLPEIIDPTKGSFELNTDFAKMIQRFKSAIIK